MKILCATDLLAKSESAVKRGEKLADHLGAALTLLHVVAPSESGGALEQTLQVANSLMKARAEPPSWRARQPPDVAVRTGNPARIILDMLAQSSASLLILGPHRKRSKQDTLEGTIAEKALATRSCPVLVVQKEPRGEYQRVLLALDFSPASATAVRAAESLVFTANVDGQVVHAYPPPRFPSQHIGTRLETAVAFASDDSNFQAHQVLRDLRKTESDDCARYEILVEQSHAASAILRAIDEYKPDLLVMGTRGRGHVRRTLMSRVVNRVLHEVVCDTLVVPEASVDGSARVTPSASGTSSADPITLITFIRAARRKSKIPMPARLRAAEPEGTI